jgi:hypothetical protein
MSSPTQITITKSDGSKNTVDLVDGTQTDFFGEPSGTGGVKTAAVSADGTMVGSYNPPEILTTPASRRLSGSNRLLAGLSQKNKDRYL